MKHLAHIMLEESIRFAREEKGLTLKELSAVLVEVLDEAELEAIIKDIQVCLQFKNQMEELAVRPASPIQ